MSGMQITYVRVYKVLPGKELPVATFHVGPGQEYETEDAAKFAGIKLAKELTDQEFPSAFVARLVSVGELWRTP
jgi:hypothetical protein